MDTLLETLRHRRDELADRGAKLAKETRDRGLSALGKVRSGALDWRRTLATRKAELDEQPRGWFRFAGLQVRVLEGVDRVLARLSDRMRDEMKRLRRLELPQPAAAEREVAAEAPARRTQAAKAKAKKPAARTAPAAKRLVLPIADYDSRTAKDVVSELPRLSDSQCAAVRTYERANKKRKTVLAALDARLGG